MNATYTEDQTAAIAQKILALLVPSEEQATVLALQGDLGAGKTTLTKSIAAQLGVEETVVSPTFVIAKFYDSKQGYDHLVHIDAYRIESTDELKPLGWEHIVQQPKTLVVVEWPERISEALPKDMHHFAISHEGDQRMIKQL